METYGAGNQGGDYAGMAQAMGAEAIRVNHADEIAPAIQTAQHLNDEGKVVVVEIATRQYAQFSQYPELLS